MFIYIILSKQGAQLYRLNISEVSPLDGKTQISKRVTRTGLQ